MIGQVEKITFFFKQKRRKQKTVIKRHIEYFLMMENEDLNFEALKFSLIFRIHSINTSRSGWSVLKIAKILTKIINLKIMCTI